jgi:hypothetical protein
MDECPCLLANHPSLLSSIRSSVQQEIEQRMLSKTIPSFANPQTERKLTRTGARRTGTISSLTAKNHPSQQV